jgi:F-type H+-transporting ATPase subunit epsilon
VSRKRIELDIVSAEKSIFNGSVYSLVVTGTAGELGIYPGHTALLTSIRPGFLEAELEEGSRQVFYLSGGLLEVQPDKVTVLADTALRAVDIDELAVENAKLQAEKALSENTSAIEYTQALAELAQATAQLRALEAFKHKKRR